MNMDEDQCWARLADARHGVLATVHRRRGVDAVPVVFAVVSGAAGPTLVLPIDTVKPKRSTRLQRVANIEADARCVLLVEHYEDDWTQLWWVRVHGRAAVSPLSDAVAGQLAGRFGQYQAPGSVTDVIIVQPTEVSGWCASGTR